MSLADWHNLDEKNPIYSIKPLNIDTEELIMRSEDILKNGEQLAPTCPHDDPDYMPEYRLNIQILFNGYFWPKYFLLNKPEIFLRFLHC